ncbi:TraR/DksA family transcriptional regulator [Marinobacteraceae bacterium S3BR75-40.1]
MSELEPIRQYLLQRRQELEKRIASIKSDLGQALDHDFAEQAVEQENSEVLQSLGREAEAEIAKINRALIRMDEGSYGECVDCGEPIPVERLKARPYSSRCVDCASRQEQGA